MGMIRGFMKMLRIKEKLQRKETLWLLKKEHRGSLVSLVNLVMGSHGLNRLRN